MPIGKLNAKQRIALQRYADDGTVKYPYELQVRASTAAALYRRGLLRYVFDDISIHDWSKYIVTEAGRAALAGAEKGRDSDKRV